MKKNKDIDPKIIGVIASLLLAIGTVGAFFYLWTMSKSFSKDLPVSDSLNTVEIETVKKDAENVLANLEKVSDMPIATPIDKMGKENPFVPS